MNRARSDISVGKIWQLNMINSANPPENNMIASQDCQFGGGFS